MEYSAGSVLQEDLEFMGISSTIYRGFLGPCLIGQDDMKAYIALSPKNHPVTDYLQHSLEQQLGSFGMKVMFFDSKEDVLEYTGNENYELLDNLPGVCFGVSLEIKEGQVYDAYYHFIDQDRRSWENLPSQLDEPVDPFVRAPQTAKYETYRDGGFLYLQGLVANAVL